MITIKILSFTLQMYLLLIYPKYYKSGTIYIHILHIVSRLFELFSKEVRVDKRLGLSFRGNERQIIELSRTGSFFFLILSRNKVLTQFCP